MSETAALTAGERDRALGALQGLAIGDALGMPFQLLRRDAVRERTGGVVDGFVEAEPEHPLAGGMPAGAITEDEALATGLTLEELRMRSFLAILRGRTKR